MRTDTIRKEDTVTNSYVAIDIETTGLEPRLDKITEIAALRVVDGAVEGRFVTLVNPGRPLGERIVELTGITDDMVKDAPGIEEILDEVLAFTEDLPLLGHQIIFDYGFLVQAAVNQKRKFEKYGVDTLKLCRYLMPGEEKKNLSAACAYFEVTQDTAHRALSDAYAAHNLYQELKKRFGKERPELFTAKMLQYKAKKERTASKRQKEHLQDLLKYHRIDITVEIDHMSGNEISRMIDKIIFQYGRIPENAKKQG